MRGMGKCTVAYLVRPTTLVGFCCTERRIEREETVGSELRSSVWGAGHAPAEYPRSRSTALVMVQWYRGSIF